MDSDTNEIDYGKLLSKAQKWLYEKTDMMMDLELNVGKYEGLFDVSFSGSKILLNRKVFEWRIEKSKHMTSMYKNRGRNYSSDKDCERVAILIHEVTECYLLNNSFLRENGEMPVKLGIYPFFMHEFANYMEDIFRKENNLLPDDHHFKHIDDLEQKFENAIKYLKCKV